MNENAKEVPVTIRIASQAAIVERVKTINELYQSLPDHVRSQDWHDFESNSDIIMSIEERLKRMVAREKKELGTMIGFARRTIDGKGEDD